jgi:hypothetical protein
MRASDRSRPDIRTSFHPAAHDGMSGRFHTLIGARLHRGHSNWTPHSDGTAWSAERASAARRGCHGRLDLASTLISRQSPGLAASISFCTAARADASSAYAHASSRPVSLSPSRARTRHRTSRRSQMSRRARRPHVPFHHLPTCSISRCYRTPVRERQAPEELLSKVRGCPIR